jgi:hypothetical protein
MFSRANQLLLLTELAHDVVTKRGREEERCCRQTPTRQSVSKRTHPNCAALLRHPIQLTIVLIKSQENRKTNSRKSRYFSTNFFCDFLAIVLRFSQLYRMAEYLVQRSEQYLVRVMHRVVVNLPALLHRGCRPPLTFFCSRHSPLLRRSVDSICTGSVRNKSDAEIRCHSRPGKANDVELVQNFGQQNIQLRKFFLCGFARSTAK